MRLVLLVTALACISTVAVAQVAPLVSLLSVGEYFGAAYTEAPVNGTDYVLFVGEPIRFRISVINTGPDDGELRFGRPNDAPANFVVQALRDEEAFPVSVTIGQPTWHQADGQDYPVGVNDRLLLRAKDAIQWRIAVVGSLPPGKYRVRVTLDGTGTRAQPIIARASTTKFEVRARSEQNRVEILRREASRLFVNGDYDNADTAIRRLEQAHPASIEARLLRGLMARTRGAEDIARSYFGRALDALRNGEDVLLLRYHDPTEIKRRVATVAALIGPR